MEINKRSIWLKFIVGINILEGILYLYEPFGLFKSLIRFFISYRLWQRNKFWKNIQYYIGIPLTLLIGGFVFYNDDVFQGIGIIIEGLILFILYTISWNEFIHEERDNKEYVCGKCKEKILESDKYCRNCNEIIDWEN